MKLPLKRLTWLMLGPSVLSIILLAINAFQGPRPEAEEKPQAEVPLKGNQMTAKVRREGAKVWIEGVKGWDFSRRGSSVHAAMETVMRTIGEDISYDYLLGTSGLAFRMQVHKGWCPSSPHSFCGYMCVQGSVNALPWKVRAYEVEAGDAMGVRQARQAVAVSIDRGIPCTYGSEEDGVIVGYQKGGEEWICIHPFAGGKMFVETGWPWGIGVYTERKARLPDRRALVLESLRQAVQMARTEKVNDYFCGFNAWQRWIVRLRDEKWVEQGLNDGATAGGAVCGRRLGVERRGQASAG